MARGRKQAGSGTGGRAGRGDLSAPVPGSLALDALAFAADDLAVSVDLGDPAAGAAVAACTIRWQGHAVGSSRWLFDRDRHGRPRARCDTLFLQPSARQAGVADRVLRAHLEGLAAAGCAAITVTAKDEGVIFWARPGLRFGHLRDPADRGEEHREQQRFLGRCRATLAAHPDPEAAALLEQMAGRRELQPAQLFAAGPAGQRLLRAGRFWFGTCFPLRTGGPRR